MLLTKDEKTLGSVPLRERAIPALLWIRLGATVFDTIKRRLARGSHQMVGKRMGKKERSSKSKHVRLQGRADPPSGRKPLDWKGGGDRAQPEEGIIPLKMGTGGGLTTEGRPIGGRES